MNEKIIINNNLEIFYNNLISIYKRFLFEEYTNIKIKIVSVKRYISWNLDYILFELTSENKNLKQINYSENFQILLYENTIDMDDFFKYFLKEEKNWFFVDNNLKMVFNNSISFDTSDDTLIKKIESNCLRQRIECSKPIHLEYMNFFRVKGTAFSNREYDEEDFTDDNNNLIKAHEAVRDFLGFRLNSLGNPAIYISYPIESFQLSKRIDFQESVFNLSLLCRFNEYYRDKIMPVYIKEGQRKVFSQEEEILQIPYDYSGQIDISIYTRPQFGISSSKETLFKEILNFPEIMIDELKNKLKLVENDENYKKCYEISKNIIQSIGYNEELKTKFENLKPESFLFGMNGTEHSPKTWILPLDYEKLQNKKDELIKFLENIKKPKDHLLQNRDIIMNTYTPEQEQELSRLSRRLNKEKEKIVKWLDYFQLDEYNYALKLLDKLKVVNDEELKEICKKLYKKILEKFNLQDLIFISIGGEAESNHYISYHFKLYNDISEEQFINKWEPKFKELNGKIIIYLDDISSTGKQLCNNWTNLSKRLKNEFISSNTFIFAPLFLTEKAKQKIEEETKFQVIFLDENLLMEKNNVLSEEAKIFKGKELRKATEIFTKYGRKLYPKGPLGYGNSALLIVFPYNTPNNTLPVIWGESFDINFKWAPLFPRYESKNRT